MELMVTFMIDDKHGLVIMHYIWRCNYEEPNQINTTRFILSFFIAHGCTFIVVQFGPLWFFLKPLKQSSTLF